MPGIMGNRFSTNSGLKVSKMKVFIFRYFERERGGKGNGKEKLNSFHARLIPPLCPVNLI